MGDTGLFWDEKVEARFDAYVNGLANHLGHADRNTPFIDYCIGLLIPGERKRQLLNNPWQRPPG